VSHSIIESCIGCGACARACPTGAAAGFLKELHAIEAALCINCGSCGRVCPAGAVLDFRGRLVRKLNKTDWIRPVILAEKCYACENCVEVCPTAALSMKSEKAPLKENAAVLSAPEKCVSCRWCLENCQFGAIVMEARGVVA
jgi:formate hydrogenlyase subunit 6/NADH:ubiquinone oxidoreductase subunit I